MTIGERLKEIREKNNIDRKIIAERLKIDVSSLSKIESNKQMPSAKIIADICLEFNFDPYWILLGKESNFISDDEMKIIKGYKNCSEKEKGRIEEIIDSSEGNKQIFEKAGNL